MVVRTGLALCSVSVRLGVRLVLGRRCSVRERDRRIEYEVSHGLPLGLTHCFKGLVK